MTFWDVLRLDREGKLTPPIAGAGRAVAYDRQGRTVVDRDYQLGFLLSALDTRAVERAIGLVHYSHSAIAAGEAAQPGESEALADLVRLLEEELRDRRARGEDVA